MNKYDVIADAARLVENHLEVVETLTETRKYRMDERSRLICRCSACRAENERATAWAVAMRTPAGKAAAAEKTAPIPALAKQPTSSR